jgi:hypothetical protein
MRNPTNVLCIFMFTFVVSFSIFTLTQREKPVQVEQPIAECVNLSYEFVALAQECDRLAFEHIEQDLSVQQALYTEACEEYNYAVARFTVSKHDDLKDIEDILNILIDAKAKLQRVIEMFHNIKSA